MQLIKTNAAMKLRALELLQEAKHGRHAAMKLAVRGKIVNFDSESQIDAWLQLSGFSRNAVILIAAVEVSAAVFLHWVLFKFTFQVCEFAILSLEILLCLIGILFVDWDFVAPAAPFGQARTRFCVRM